MMTGLMVFVERGHVAQIVFGCVVCFVVFSFNLSFSPIFDKEVNRVQNIAMLELLATMFLGLLLKVEMVNVVEERSKVFDMTVTAVTVFVFVYPIITLLLSSEKLHSMLSMLGTRISKLASKCARVFKKRHQPANMATANNVAIFNNITSSDAATANSAAVRTNASQAVAAVPRKGMRVAPEQGEAPATHALPRARQGARNDASRTAMHHMLGHQRTAKPTTTSTSTSRGRALLTEDLSLESFQEPDPITGLRSI